MTQLRNVHGEEVAHTGDNRQPSGHWPISSLPYAQPAKSRPSGTLIGPSRSRLCSYFQPMCILQLSFMSQLEKLSKTRRLRPQSAL